MIRAMSPCLVFHVQKKQNKMKTSKLSLTLTKKWVDNANMKCCHAALNIKVCISIWCQVGDNGRIQ